MYDPYTRGFVNKSAVCSKVGTDVSNHKFSISNLIWHKMNIDLDVLCACMIDRVLGQGTCSKIITPDYRSPSIEASLTRLPS